MRLMPTLLLVPLVAACQGREPDPRGVQPGETLLTTSATARAETKPDEARLSLGVQSLGASAAEAAKANREKMERVTTTLSRLGVQGDDLQTQNLSLQRIDYGPERGRFRADNTVEVRIRDMAKVGEAVASATDAGANLLGGPNLRVSDPEGATRAAYANAYRAARARAEAYAEAAGLSIERVVGIYDGGSMGSPPPHGRGAAMDMTVQTAAPEEAPPPVNAVPFSPGVNTGDVRVRVDFALRPQ